MTKWFKGLRLKLLLLVLIPVTLFTLLGWRATIDLIKEADNLKRERTVVLPLAQLSGEMQSSLHRMMRGLWSAYGTHTDSDLMVENLKRFDKAQEDFKKYRERYLSLPRSQFAVERFRVIDEDVNKAFGEMEKVRSALRRGGRDVADIPRLMTSDVRAALAKAEKGFEELDQVREENARKNQKLSEEATAREILLIGSVAAGGSLFLLIFGLGIAMRLTKDLSSIADRISKSGANVGFASAQLSEASQQVSEGSSEAAASLEETVSSLEELSSMVSRNADNAKEASALSASARSSAEQGESEIRQLIGAMGEIAHSSKQIEDIINVIDDIAFQTNLLALNAAVEAARAGEQGRGFAVVAEAVRSLAQRSSSAAKDINSLIKESVNRVERGSQIADQSGVVLKNIVTSVKKVADLNNEISAASSEQSTGLQQISKAMTQLDQATQSNASAAEETHASSQSMSEEARSLQAQVSDLVVLITGDNQTESREKSAQAKATERSEAKPVSKAKPARTVTVPVQTKATAAQVIPFGDESDQTQAEARPAKVGTIDGF